MEIAIALVLAIAFSFILKKPIKACPWAFYLLAVVVAVGFAVITSSGTIPAWLRPVYPYLQRCLFAFGLFVVVMFIGVTSPTSRIRHYLVPIRGELSIIAAILVAGHVANYLDSYIDQFLSGFVGISTPMIVSFCIAFLLLILLVILAVTSFATIRRAMNGAVWKRVQLLAYPFFILTYFHILFLLGPSAGSPGQKAFVSVAVYSVIFAAYVILRVGRAVLDRRAAAATKLDEKCCSAS